MEQIYELADRLNDSRTLKISQTIVITGANSGIGLYAAKLFFTIDPINRLVLVARNIEKAMYAKEQVLSVISNPNEYAENIIPLACDHTSLDSVRAFVQELNVRLDETWQVQKWALNGIDVLCLNAAVLVPRSAEPAFTKDDMEITFQTNHLSPFSIANLLHDRMNPGGRIVLSTSGLHVGQTLKFDGVLNSDSGQIQRHFSMLDGSEFHFKTSYALSKLCNVAMCAELNERLSAKDVVVNCFSPGLMRKSGLFRNQTSVDEGIENIHRKQEVLLKEKSVEWGAGALVYMALADATGLIGGEYWRDAGSKPGNAAIYGEDFCPMKISDEQIKKEDRLMLWNISCKLADLSSV